MKAMICRNWGAPEALALAAPIVLMPLRRTDLSSEFLLGLNLIDGIIDAAH